MSNSYNLCRDDGIIQTFQQGRYSLWNGIPMQSAGRYTSWLNDLEDIGQGQKVLMHNTPSHTSDGLCLILKESIQNCKCFRADTACRTDRRTDRQTEWNLYIPQTTSLCIMNNIYWTNYVSFISMLKVSNYISPEAYEQLHPHNWPVTTTNHLPPHLANCLGHQRVSVFV